MVGKIALWVLGVVLTLALVATGLVIWSVRRAFPTHAGALTFISMSPAAQMWQAPWIAFIALGFILVGWLGGRRMPFDAPVGLVAVVVSTAVAWIAVAAGLVRVSSSRARCRRFAGRSSRWRLPFPTADVVRGLSDIAPLLASAIPLGVYNFTEGMTNVESAAAAGDRYSTRQVLPADGLGASSAPSSARPSRPRSTSVTPAGSRSAGGSATPW